MELEVSTRVIRLTLAVQPCVDMTGGPGMVSSLLCFSFPVWILEI